jgi:serine protease Do
LQRGDAIVAIDDKPVKDNDDLFLLIGLALAGNKATIEVDRNGTRRKFTPELAKFYVPGNVLASKRPQAPGGLRVDYLSILTQKPAGPFGRGFQSIPAGVLIRDVLDKSSAAEARLQKDKIITHVNRRPVETPKMFYDTMAEFAGKQVELTVRGFDNREDRVTIDTKDQGSR